jgi:hypothetical protein
VHELLASVIACAVVAVAALVLIVLSEVQQESERLAAPEGRVVLAFPVRIRVATGLATLLFGLGAVVLMPDGVAWFHGSMSVIAASTWVWVGRRTWADADGIHGRRRFGVETSVRWAEVQRVRYSMGSGNMAFVGPSAVVIVGDQMYGIDEFVRLCTQRLPLELIQREFARVGWLAERNRWSKPRQE